MKPKTFLAGTLCLLQIHLFAQNTTITGDLKGLKADQVKLGYQSGKDRKTDSMRVTDGHFSWTGNIAEPQQVYLMLPERYFPFFAQSGQITITGIGDSTESYVVNGSKIQDEHTAYERSVKDLSDRETPLYEQYDKATKEEQAALEAQLDEIRMEKRKRADAYIQAHPSSPYSVHLVAERAAYGTDYAQVKTAYDLLDAKARQTAAGKALTERLSVLKRSALGVQMIDFSQKDTAGSVVRYAHFKGKYVLVDFWASWCGPCRAENPNVLQAYEAYKDKNFTVIGISLDEQGENWKKAIRDDKMPWTELSDLKGWKNEVSTYYGIQGIPSNLLVDPSGKIVAKDLRGEALHKKLRELLN